MKTFKIIIGILMIGGLFSCQNQDWEFPDFDYTSTYFPYQYPIRTLVLGDYVYDNENDNDLKFLISARVGGMYENNTNWTVDFQLNESLVNDLTTSSGQEVKVLPQEYYTLSPVNQLVIPKGEFDAGIEVQLTEAFLEDTMATYFNYVIPLEITASTTDSVLVGFPTADEPDPRIVEDWLVQPKNFTLFGIKYVNEYHGKYLRRGQSVITDNSSGNVVETVVYRANNVVEDEIWPLETTGRRDVIVDGQLRSSTGSPGDFAIKLSFDSNDKCTITETSSSDFPVTGSGSLVKDGDEWGGKSRDAIYLNYEVQEGTRTHTITDTLVFRDKDVRFEEFEPVIIE